MGKEAIKHKAIFLDRDGVINEDTGYVAKIEDLQIIDEALDAIRALTDSKFKLFIVTNQSGVARGLISIESLQKIHELLLEKVKDAGGLITDIAFCPHYIKGKIPKYNIKCNCRKPMPGLILSLAKRHNIDLKQSIMVGDKITDIECALNAGIKQTYLIESRYHAKKFPLAYRTLMEVSKKIIS